MLNFVCAINGLLHRIQRALLCLATYTHVDCMSCVWSVLYWKFNDSLHLSPRLSRLGQMSGRRSMSCFCREFRGQFGILCTSTLHTAPSISRYTYIHCTCTCTLIVGKQGFIWRLHVHVYWGQWGENDRYCTRIWLWEHGMGGVMGFNVTQQKYLRLISKGHTCVWCKKHCHGGARRVIPGQRLFCSSNQQGIHITCLAHHLALYTYGEP